MRFVGLSSKPSTAGFLDLGLKIRVTVLTELGRRTCRQGLGGPDDLAAGRSEAAGHCWVCWFVLKTIDRFRQERTAQGGIGEVAWRRKATGEKAWWPSDPKYPDPDENSLRVTFVWVMYLG